MADENIVSGKKYKVLQDGIWKIFSFFTKASDVEFDDGMNAEEKIQFIEENGVGVELTLAEYEALSEEEKNNGTYWINDTNEPLGDGSRFLKNTDVVDSLDVPDPTAPLSANMGKELNDKIDEKFARHNILNGVVNGTYNVDCTPYTRFSIDFVIADGSAKFPLFVPFISFGSRYRVAYVADVYADVTINADSIVVNILSGSYTGCSIFVYGYK